MLTETQQLCRWPMLMKHTVSGLKVHKIVHIIHVMLVLFVSQSYSSMLLNPSNFLFGFYSVFIIGHVYTTNILWHSSSPPNRKRWLGCPHCSPRCTSWIRGSKSWRKRKKGTRTLQHSWMLTSMPSKNTTTRSWRIWGLERSTSNLVRYLVYTLCPLCLSSCSQVSVLVTLW